MGGQKTKEAKGKKEETSDTQKWFPRPMAAQPRGGVGGEGGIELVSRKRPSPLALVSRIRLKCNV